MKKDEMIELYKLAWEIAQESASNAAKYPTDENIRVVIVEPNKYPYEKIIKNDLETFQKIVGGYIENVFIGPTERDIRAAIIVNEEGLILNLEPNRIINNRTILHGPMIITAYNLEGYNISLTEKEADHFIELFSNISVCLP